MKKLLFILLLGVSVFILPNTILADQSETQEINWDEGEVTDRMKINDEVTVYKLSDGRVKPVEESKANSLEEKDLDKIITFMGLNPDNFIKTVKLDIVTFGGKVAEGSDEYKLKIRNYNKNNKLESETEINLNENTAVSNNITSINKDSLSIMGDSTSGCGTLTGCFEGNLSIVYAGKVGSNYKYRFYYHFSFPDGSNGYDDYVGLAWKGTGTKVAGSDMAKQFTYLNGTMYPKDLKIQKYNIYGSVYEVPSSTSKFSGYYRTEVYYSDRYAGDKEILAGSYGATWQSVWNSISIGPASINISKTEKEYILEKNFTVGY